MCHVCTILFVQPEKAFSVNYKSVCSFLLINHKLEKWVIEQHLCMSDSLLLCVNISWLQRKESQRIMKEVGIGEEMLQRTVCSALGCWKTAMVKGEMK